MLRLSKKVSWKQYQQYLDKHYTTRGDLSIDAFAVSKSIPLFKVLYECELVDSTSEAKRLIKQNVVKVGDKIINNPNQTLELKHDIFSILNFGKTTKCLLFKDANDSRAYVPTGKCDPNLPSIPITIKEKLLQYQWLQKVYLWYIWKVQINHRNWRLR